MASSSSGEYVSRYDVFLSFRGETRHGFTDHLYEKLCKAGICTFRDNNNIRIGEDLKPEFKRAIRESRASIIILSELYATSRWCLDELYLILQERKRRIHHVLPIFYHVNASDVRNREKNFKIAAKDNKWTEDKMKLWNKALKKVGNMAGKVPSGSEVEFSKQIVQIIKDKLNFIQVYRQPNLVGMDTRDKEINAWLENSNDSEILAIWGMDGGGKSTLAMHIVCSNLHKFESVSILEDIGSRSPEELRQLQGKLIRDITEGKEETTPSVFQATYQIEKALKTNKAIVVLDNIVTEEQLKKFLGTGTETDRQIKTKTKSKIIITTTEKNASTWFQSTSWRCKEHEMKLLNDVDSLKLLKLHGFKPNDPLDGYEEHAKRVLVCCQGNPLALKVWGSSLCCDSSYTSDQRKKYWESRMTSFEREVPLNIQEVLIKSYSSLQQLTLKELFLHIACFFNGKDKDYVEKILEPDYNAISGIVTLTSKCLLSVSPDNKLMMHQLLQDVGRTLVHAESPRLPGDRSRVWRDNESHQVLSRDLGSTKVLGLALDMEMLRQRSQNGKKMLSNHVNTVSFKKMNSLKLLQLNQLELEGSYMNILEDLRWLCWRKFCLKAIPPQLDMENLVAIDMSCSKLVVFQPPDVLPLLKILNLTDSLDLREIRNISRLLNLDTLILVNCRKMVCVYDTLRGLTSLDTLDISGCDNLCKREEPNSFEKMTATFFGAKETEQSSFLLPDLVQRLIVKDCNLEIADNFLQFRDQSVLEYLNLANNPFEILPNYSHLKQLLILDLTGCEKLRTLLCLPRNLAELYISNCESLEKVTFELHKYTLQKIQYKGCVNLLEVEDFFKLVPVYKLKDADLGNMKWLRDYQDREVFLVGDGEVTKGRRFCLQMLYEFNIMSISLPDIQKPNRIPAYQYTSQYPKLVFKVPKCSRTIKGLNLTFKYTMQGDDDWVWFTKITTNKGVDLIYNAKVFGRPASDENGVWLSYWPIGSKLHHGDEVNVVIVLTQGLEFKGCGANLVFADEDDESDSFNDSNESFVDDNDFFEDNNSFYENNSKTFEDNNEQADILGVDISEFRLSTGTYYLCRRDYSHLMEVGRLNPNWFKNLVGDTIDYTEIGGWRKTGRPDQPYRSYTKLKTIGCIIYFPHMDQDESAILETTNLSKTFDSVQIRESTSNAHGYSAATKDTKTLGSSYDVFVSFVGEDTRNSFTDHLYDALKKAGISTSLDIEAIRRGEKLPSQIKTQIEQSKVSIVVISEAYATSASCLDELALILEQRRRHNHQILPVFYHVNPSDIRREYGSLSFILNNTSRRTYHSGKRWKDALEDVANIPCMLISRKTRETDVLRNTIDDISKRINHQVDLPPDTKDSKSSLYVKTEEYTATKDKDESSNETVNASKTYNSDEIGEESTSSLRGDSVETKDKDESANLETVNLSKTFESGEIREFTLSPHGDSAATKEKDESAYRETTNLSKTFNSYKSREFTLSLHGDSAATTDKQQSASLETMNLSKRFDADEIREITLNPHGDSAATKDKDESANLQTMSKAFDSGGTRGITLGPHGDSRAIKYESGAIDKNGREKKKKKKEGKMRKYMRSLLGGCIPIRRRREETPENIE